MKQQIEIHAALDSADWLTTAEDAEEGMALRSVDEPDLAIVEVSAAGETIITAQRGDRAQHKVRAEEIDNDPTRVVDADGSLIDTGDLPRLRDAAGLSRADFAACIGVMESTVEHWETVEGRRPSRENMALIERLFRE